MVKAGVQSRLKDPNSAMFSSIVATSTQGGKLITICGLVNAKNSFGGYTGSQVFHTLSFRRKDGTLDVTPAMISIGDYVAEKMSADCVL
ncbi:hypothetical protein LB524_21385 [Mesorhizobium sp. ESP6-5]|nr:hypothetical protein [Mesorhizobium sp. ESP6-5]